MTGAIMNTKEDIKINDMEARIAELETKLKEAELAALAVEAAGFDIWENNFVTGETFGTNRNLFLSLGYDDDELPTNLEETFTKIHPDDLEKALSKVSEHFDGISPNYRAEMRIQAKDGSWVWIGSYGAVVERDVNNEVTRFLGMTFNIDQRRITEEAIKEMAYRDSLTELSNRRVLYEKGGTEIEVAKRRKQPLSMVMMDIDNFKALNDTYGHLEGDNILKIVSNKLIECMRQIDLKIRFGGDELLAVLLNTDKKAAYETAERFRNVIESLEFDLPYKITLSIGVVELQAEDTLETLLERVDKALYLAKSQGRNHTTLG
jgi:diguanylate cyclase (GGDEF)-like protein/PAS domain S-box-containing protein